MSEQQHIGPTRRHRQRISALRIHERRRRIGEALLSNYSYRGVQRRFLEAGERISISTIHSDAAALEQQWREEGEEYIRQALPIELRRLETLQAVLWQRALDGELSAVDRWLRIAERRASLCGTDAPKKVMASTPDDIQRFVNGLRTKLLARLDTETADQILRDCVDLIPT